MPAFTDEIQGKIDELRALLAAGVKPYVGEVVEIAFGEPDGTLYFGFTPYDILAGFRNDSLPEIKAKIIAAGKDAPFLELPQTAAIGDDKVSVKFSDLNYEVTKLCARHGEGLRARVLAYYPQVDLLLEDFVGVLKAPKSPDGRTVQLEVASGFRSGDLLLPNRRPFASCPFIWGGHLNSQHEIDEHRGCPHNAHLAGVDPEALVIIGTLNDPATGLPWTDCARDSETTCFNHLLTKRFFPGIKTIAESIPNNQTKGANQSATAIGNENTFTDPIRMIYGYRMVKGLRLIRFRPENDTRHPEKGWVAFVFEVAEGPLDSMGQPNVNGVWVAYEHLNLRDGSLGQPPTFFTPSEESMSGTAHFSGRIQGDFRNATASSLSAVEWVRGFRDIRVYSDPETYVEQYATSPAWCVLDMLTRKRGGYGEDFARYDIQSVIDTAAWHAETVAFHDANGNLFTGTRSTFNAELNARATQQQIRDACAAARMAVPFSWQGKKTFYPLRKETIDGSIPVFTDRGSSVNVCRQDGSNLPMAVPSWTSDDELINQAVAKFDDESNSWAETQLTFSDQPQQLRAGRAQSDTTVRVIPKNVTGFGITNMSEAARFGNLALYLGLFDEGGIYNNLRFVITTWFTEAIGIRPYSLVKLELAALDALKEAAPDRFNFDYFRVIKKVRKGSLKVELTCQAYPVDFYERMEDVLQPPPLVAPGYTPNPGGQPHDRPVPVGFDAVGFTGDRVHFQLSAV
jgi:hypothetical protein